MNTKTTSGKMRRRNPLAKKLKEDPLYRSHYINKTKRSIEEREANKELKEYYANQEA